MISTSPSSPLYSYSRLPELLSFTRKKLARKDRVAKEPHAARVPLLSGNSVTKSASSNALVFVSSIIWGKLPFASHSAGSASVGGSKKVLGHAMLAVLYGLVLPRSG